MKHLLVHHSGSDCLKQMVARETQLLGGGNQIAACHRDVVFNRLTSSWWVITSTNHSSCWEDLWANDSIFHHPAYVGRKNTTYIPCTVLALVWGGYML